MRFSRFFIKTLRETPAEAELISHKLLLRAGYIRQLTTGIYSWMPLGLRVLKKISAVVREEMDAIDGTELLLPAVQPTDLWRQSGRLDNYGAELLRFLDRHQREYCIGPTHEEVITDLVRREVSSYRALPLMLYQIQTKFRDEIRPRFGIMRAREFIMKDAYSFHQDEQCLQKTYQNVYKAYCRIFERLGLKYRAVLADTGNIGGKHSHEFHVLADSGEDQIGYVEGGVYSANLEMIHCAQPTNHTKQPSDAKVPLRKVDTPDVKSIDEVAGYLKISAEQCLKTLVVVGEQDQLIAIVLRGDDVLNPLKVAKLPHVANPLRFASTDQIHKKLGVSIGSIGPIELSIPVYADYAVVEMTDCVCGANEDAKHWIGVEPRRDFPAAQFYDVRNARLGDFAPEDAKQDQGKPLSITRGIEVGHIFQLGAKYSTSMQACYRSCDGDTKPMIMGCYGIGISRIVAAAVEQHNDTYGICWPKQIAPFSVVITPINMHKFSQIKEAVDKLYQQLLDHNIDVLLDDRDERPGIMFADAELIGIPIRLTLGKKSFEHGTVECKFRNREQSIDLPLDKVCSFLQKELTTG